MKITWVIVTFVITIVVILSAASTINTVSNTVLAQNNSNSSSLTKLTDGGSITIKLEPSSNPIKSSEQTQLKISFFKHNLLTSLNRNANINLRCLVGSLSIFRWPCGSFVILMKLMRIQWHTKRIGKKFTAGLMVNKEYTPFLCKFCLQLDNYRESNFLCYLSASTELIV